MKLRFFPLVCCLCAAPMMAHAVYDPIKRAHKALEQMDKNHNGSVSEQEYLRPANIRFNRFDTNKDSRIARQELYDYWKNKRKNLTSNVNAWEGPTNNHFKKHDKNKDDVVTRKEYLERSQLKFDGMDLDHNSILSAEEIRAYWTKRSEEAEAYRTNKGDSHSN
ncbi:MAG: EF-hand domain-containing protein [Mariprofundaceae bacterium]|nr:EF-hand domain-containing protein [Mariprofundaceae bacterium]